MGIRAAWALLLTVLWVSAGPARAEFKDRLAIPASMTARVASAPLTAVTAVGGTKLVAVGWRGVIAVSEDAGQSWTQVASPVSVDLVAVNFPTPQHGWVVGHDGVLLESTDAGKSWLKRLDGAAIAELVLNKYTPLAQQSNDPAYVAALRDAKSYAKLAPGFPLFDVWFESEQVGYVTGFFNVLMRTTDSGKSWEPLIDRTDNPDGHHLYAVRTTGADVFIAGELGSFLRRDQKADRFVAVSMPYNGSFLAVLARSDVVLAMGLRGNAFRSADSGKTWQKVDFGATPPALITAVTSLEDGRIVAVTAGAEILVSTDGGQRFTRRRGKAPMSYSSVAPVGAKAVVVVGTQGVRVETIE